MNQPDFLLKRIPHQKLVFNPKADLFRTAFLFSEKENFMENEPTKEQLAGIYALRMEIGI